MKVVAAVLAVVLVVLLVVLLTRQKRRAPPSGMGVNYATLPPVPITTITTITSPPVTAPPAQVMGYSDDEDDFGSLA